MTRLSRRRLFLIYIAVLGLVLTIGAEFILRLKGRPFRASHDSVRLDPPGSLYRPHPTLGYVNSPGQYSITVNRTHTFTVTHLEDSSRATGPDARICTSDRPTKSIWVFGCSFTYGWGLDDHSTYPWLLQTILPEYRLMNFGVAGYGTIHSLIQFQEALKERDAPDVAILAYGAIHDSRNTFSRGRRKRMAQWNHLGWKRHPSARLTAADKLVFSQQEIEYREIPFEGVSAVADWAVDLYNSYDQGSLGSQEVTKKLILQFSDLAAAEGVRFVVVGITKENASLATLRFLQSRGVPAVDVSLDLTDRLYRIPLDSHPNAQANELYASRIVTFLQRSGIL